MARFNKLKQHDDGELVALCNDGDASSAEGAFNELYRRHKDFVLRTALSVVHDNSLALDALQETFSYLLRQFPPAGSGLTLTAKLTTFLYPVARNSAISEWRKAKRTQSTEELDPDSLPADPTAATSDIEAVLRELSFERREIIHLRFIHDMSVAEIALALDIPPGTAKSRLHSAIQQLRNSPKIQNFFEK